MHLGLVKLQMCTSEHTAASGNLIMGFPLLFPTTQVYTCRRKTMTINGIRDCNSWVTPAGQAALWENCAWLKCSCVFSQLSWTCLLQRNPASADLLSKDPGSVVLSSSKWQKRLHLAWTGRRPGQHFLFLQNPWTLSEAKHALGEWRSTWGALTTKSCGELWIGSPGRAWGSSGTVTRTRASWRFAMTTIWTRMSISSTDIRELSHPF